MINSVEAHSPRMSRRERYEAYIASQHWYHLRKQKIAEHGSFCADCGRTTHIHVHHVEYRDFYDCTLEDLVVLCKLCHDDFHLAAEVYRFDYIGMGIAEIKFWLAKARLDPTFDRSRLNSKGKRRKKHTKNKPEPKKQDIQQTTARIATKALKSMRRCNFSPESISDCIRILQSLLTKTPPPPIIIPAGTTVITKELLEKCRTDAGGYTVTTLKALGLDGEFKKGWAKRLYGKEISSEQLQKAIDGRTVYGKKFSED